MKNKKLGSVNYMVILLVVISFFAGYLLFRVRSLEQKTAGNQPTEGPEQASMNYDALPKVSNKDHILGKADAEVVLIEYSDFECPFCKTFQETMKQVKEEYGDKIAWVYRDFPLSFHANAQKEAEATECVAELGGNEAYWKYADAIFDRTESNGTGFPLKDLVPLAKELGLDEKKFKSCLDSGKYAQAVKDEMAAGGLAGVQGTPGTFIIAKSGKKDFIGGALPLEQVKAQIDAILKK